MSFHIILFFLCMIHSFLLADEPIALITKSRGNVKYKTYSEKKFRSNALVNTPIFHGNEIKTKAKFKNLQKVKNSNKI